MQTKPIVNVGHFSERMLEYEKLVNERPEKFKNNGSLDIITDIDSIRRFEDESGRKIGINYKSPFNMMVVDLVQDKLGKRYAYERVMPTVSRGAVAVIPRHRDGFVLIRQYRHALRDFQWNIPRGFAKEGLTSEENAVKEIREEIGAEANNVQFLGTVAADSGLTGGTCDVFVCDVDGVNIKDGYEGIQNIAIVSTEELGKWITDGVINDSFTLSSYAMLAAKGML